MATAAKLVKIFPGLIARLHRSETNGIAESWWADSMDTPICETFTDLFSDGKTPSERHFGQPFQGPIIPFGSLVECVINAESDSALA